MSIELAENLRGLRELKKLLQGDVVDIAEALQRTSLAVGSLAAAELLAPFRARTHDDLAVVVDNWAKTRASFDLAVVKLCNAVPSLGLVKQGVTQLDFPLWATPEDQEEQCCTRARVLLTDMNVGCFICVAAHKQAFEVDFEELVLVAPQRKTPWRIVEAAAPKDGTLHRIH